MWIRGDGEVPGKNRHNINLAEQDLPRCVCAAVKIQLTIINEKISASTFRT
jgi:hypothetical protein